METLEIRKKGEYQHLVGILDTPCFPARYYVGYIKLGKDGYYPLDNATYLFHQTLEKARLALDKLVEVK